MTQSLIQLNDKLTRLDLEPQDRSGEADLVAKHALLQIRRKIAAIVDAAALFPAAPSPDASSMLQNFQDEPTKTVGSTTRAPQTQLTAWKRVLISAVVAGLIVVLFMKVGDCLGSNIPWRSNQESLEEELAKTREKARDLAEALEAQKKAAAEVDAAAEFAAQDKSGDATAVSDTLAPSNTDDFTPEELVGAMLHSAEETEKMVQDAADMVTKQTNVLVQRAKKVQEVLSGEVFSIRSRAEEFAQREAAELFEKVNAVIKEVPGSLSEGLDSVGKMAEQGSALMDLASLTAAGVQESPEEALRADVQVPPVALLVAGSFAPAQLRSIKTQAEFNVVYNGVLAAIAIAIWYVDRQKRCDDMLVWYWIEGLVAISAIIVMSSSIVRRRAAAALTIVQSHQESVEPVIKTGNAVLDGFASLQNGVGGFFKALFLYDDVVKSWPYFFSKVCTMPLTFLGGFGLYITIADVVLDEQHCSLKSVLFFMHLYSFFFMLFLLWIILSVIIWLVSAFASRSTLVTSSVIRIARQLDADIPMKIPVFMTLARAFILRESSEMLKIKESLIATEIQELERQVLEAQTKLDAQRQDLKVCEKLRCEVDVSERDMIDSYKAKLASQMAKAEPIITIIASIDSQKLFDAQVQAKEVGGAAASAAQRVTSAVGAAAGQVAQDTGASTMAAQAHAQLRANASDLGSALASGYAASGASTMAAQAHAQLRANASDLGSAAASGYAASSTFAATYAASDVETAAKVAEDSRAAEMAPKAATRESSAASSGAVSAAQLAKKGE